jgi:erythronate-4-phosphate dehydrogenase
MKTKVIFVDENIPRLAEVLEPCGVIIKFSGRQLKNIDLKDSKCGYLFVRSTTKVNAKLLEGTDVQFVGSATSGIDHIDKTYIDANHIGFCDAPGSNANSVAEYVVFAMLKWARMRDVPLRNLTIGIVGFGNIGKVVARYANNFGMKVLVNDPPLRSKGYEFPTYCEYSPFDELCIRSDVFTNHVPLTNSGKFPTFNLVDRKKIDLLRRGSLIIHASRGGVVDEDSLLERVLTHELQAAIDCWQHEPLISKVLATNIFLSTPHIAGYSRDGKLRGTLKMANAVADRCELAPDIKPLYKELSDYKPTTMEEFKDESKIFYRLRKARMLEQDSENLKATLYLGKEERTHTFDMLRKNYSPRRESL